MRAQVGIDVLGQVLVRCGAVLGPVCVVADDFVFFLLVVRLETLACFEENVEQQ